MEEQKKEIKQNINFTICNLKWLENAIERADKKQLDEVAEKIEDNLRNLSDAILYTGLYEKEFGLFKEVLD